MALGFPLFRHLNYRENGKHQNYVNNRVKNLMWIGKNEPFYAPQNLTLSAKSLSSPEICFTAGKTRLSWPVSKGHCFPHEMHTAHPVALGCASRAGIELILEWLAELQSCAPTHPLNKCSCHLVWNVMTTQHFGGLKSINKTILIRRIVFLNMLACKKMCTRFLFTNTIIIKALPFAWKSLSCWNIL